MQNCEPAQGAAQYKTIRNMFVERRVDGVKVAVAGLQPNDPGLEDSRDDKLNRDKIRKGSEALLARLVAVHG